MGQQFQLSGARQCFEMEENSDGCLSLMPKEPGIGCGESLKDGNQTPVFRDQKLEKFSKEETSSEGECREDKTTSSSGLTVLLMAPLLALASSQSNQSLPSFVKMKEIQPLHRLGQDMVNTPNYIIDTPALMMKEEDNFDSVCNNKVEDKPPSVYDQWQGNEVNSIQTINQETTMQHFFDLLDNKDIQFFDEEDIQEDRDQKIDSVRNYKVVPRIDQLNLNIDSLENTEHILLRHLFDLMEQRINSVWNGKEVTRMDQQEVESLQRFCILQGNQNFLMKNSFPTRSSMRNDSM